MRWFGKQVRPTEVAITSVDVVVLPAKKPPKAVANLIVRVTGNVIDKGAPGTVLSGVKVLPPQERWSVARG